MPCVIRPYAQTLTLCVKRKVIFIWVMTNAFFYMIWTAPTHQYMNIWKLSCASQVPGHYQVIFCPIDNHSMVHFGVTTSLHFPNTDIIWRNKIIPMHFCPVMIYSTGPWPFIDWFDIRFILTHLALKHIFNLKTCDPRLHSNIFFWWFSNKQSYHNVLYIEIRNIR